MSKNLNEAKWNYADSASSLRVALRYYIDGLAEKLTSTDIKPEEAERLKADAFRSVQEEYIKFENAKKIYTAVTTPEKDLEVKTASEEINGLLAKAELTVSKSTPMKIEKGLTKQTEQVKSSTSQPVEDPLADLTKTIRPEQATPTEAEKFPNPKKPVENESEWKFKPEFIYKNARKEPKTEEQTPKVPLKSYMEMLEDEKKRQKQQMPPQESVGQKVAKITGTAYDLFLKATGVKTGPAKPTGVFVPPEEIKIKGQPKTPKNGI